MVKLIIYSESTTETMMFTSSHFTEFRTIFNQNYIGKPIKVYCPKENWTFYDIAVKIDKKFIMHWREWDYYDFKKTRNYIIEVFNKDYKAERTITFNFLDGLEKEFKSIEDFINNKEVFIGKSYIFKGETHKKYFNYEDEGYFGPFIIDDVGFDECGGINDFWIGQAVKSEFYWSVGNAWLSVHPHEPLILRFEER